MKENELGVLDKYDVEISGTRRIRGAVLCDTNKGVFLLKNLMFSEKKLPILYELYSSMCNQGYTDVDLIVKSKEGELFVESDAGAKYILKRWFYGRECDARKETDILDGVRNLACLHHGMKQSEMRYSEEQEIQRSESSLDVFSRHNREMKKVRNFMRARATKGEFETQFLKCFDSMFEWAEFSKNRLETSHYPDMLDESQRQGVVAHGDYNYHNLILMQNRVATTGFEHFYIGPQIDDFYYFLRKIMEKNQWDVSLGNRMVEQYHRIKPISDVEMDYLAIRIAYPEKFWKLANTYNRSSKAWISAKTIEKLGVAVQQTKDKSLFLKAIFSFSLQ